MPINIRENNAKITFSKNLVSDQTLNGLTLKGTTSNMAFDVTNGLGSSGVAQSSVVLIHTGGYADQRVQAVMKFVSPTAAGAEEFGVMARIMSFDSPNQTYYYARVHQGVAKLTKVVANVFTNLTTGAFALAQNTNVTITLTCNGSTISASFDAGGSPTTVNLSATDSAIPGALGANGIVGVRSGPTVTAFYCSSFSVTQL